VKLSEPQKQLIHNAFIMLGEGVCPSPGDWCKKYRDINCPDCVLDYVLWKFDFCGGDELITEEEAKLMQERLRSFLEDAFDAKVSAEKLIKEIEEVEG